MRSTACAHACGSSARRSPGPNGDLAAARRTAGIATISLDVTPARRGGAGAFAGPRSTIGQAFHDAGHVLAVTVAVTVVAAVVVIPLAAAIALALLASTAVRRRRREAALNGPPST